MKELSTLDAMFVAIETPDYPMHGIGVVFLDPSTAPEPLTFERVKEVFAERIDYMQPWRRRLVEVPFGLDRPFWVHDEAFDLGNHLHHVAVPSPGSLEKFLALVNRIGNVPLDRDRPLWAAWFIEGLSDGRLVLVLKAHHACIDGVGGMAMLGDLIDTEPSPAPRPPPEPVEAETIPGQSEMLARALTGMLFRPARAIRGASTLVRGLLPAALPGARTDPPSDIISDPAPEAPTPHPASFNRTAGTRAHRNLAMASFDLGEVRRIARDNGGTVNDVFLAVVGGALRRYLIDRGEEPEAPLRTAVPINIRTGEEEDQIKNIFTVAATLCRVDIDDPTERLAATVAATGRLKRSGRSGSPDNVLESTADLMTPAMVNLLARTYSSVAGRVPLPFHLLLSNVPGPPETRYFAGARIDAFHVQMMTFPGLGPQVVALSVGDRLHLSITGTDEITPDIQAVADALDAEFAALRDAT